MFGYLAKILLILMFSLYIIYQYYFQFNHVQNFDGYTGYIIIMGFIYGAYKYHQSLTKVGDKISYSLLSVLGFTGIHLLLLACLYFLFKGESVSQGIIFFIKILWFLLLPTFISFLSVGIGKKTLGYIQNFESKDNIFKNISSLAIGFFTLISVITIVGMLGFYNIYSIFIIFGLFSLYSWREIKEYIIFLINYRFNFDTSEGFGIKIITTELLFIISTLLLSVNLISAFRPFPIGWDDLGAYMNYAQLLAESGRIIPLGGMTTWPIFTGIGYIFQSPTQAFYLNNLGGILSFVVMIGIFYDLLKSKTKKFFINIPLFLATIFIAMPMFIFEQAKDMKLDPGLYFISISVVYILIKILSNTQKESIKSKILSIFHKKDTHINPIYIYIFIAGILSGLAFSIKFTSLLLISGIIGLLFFFRGGIYAVLGYISLFFAIFTKFGLWKIMNVSYPYDNINFVNSFSLVTFVLGIGFLSYAGVKNKSYIGGLFKIVCSYLLGIIIALLPWFTYNIISQGNISVSSLLSPKVERLEIDYLDIYTQEELDIKEKEQKQFELNDSGTTGNEDWGRYFGYEEGINNYMKLPWNLTMQVNQKGDFTDITFIYLALLPLILLFLPYKKKYFSLGIVGLSLFSILLFVFPFTNKFLTDIFTGFTLPFGYAIILGGFLIPLIYLINTIKDSGKGTLIKYILVFSFFYTFLWNIAAYGVVWYAIVMYFTFLLLIGFGLYFVSGYSDESDIKEKQIKLIGSMVIFFIVGIYFFMSSFPNAFLNIQKAGFKEFKAGQIQSIEAPFVYNQDYLKILFNLNIADSKKQEFINQAINEETKVIIDNYNKQNQQLPATQQRQNIDVSNLDQLVKQLRAMTREVSFQQYRSVISESLENIYSGIYHPTEEFKNKKSIYRIGTFLKYYISENNKRLYEDSLVMKFDTYIKGENIEESVDNMKALGLDYLLVDLNAATIDNDPRRNLTKRYEGLLETFTSDRLELLSTDSACLRVGRDIYMSSEKTAEDLKKYIATAGVNHHSYNEKGQIFHKNNKLTNCHITIVELINEQKIDNNNFTYLLPVRERLLQPEVANDREKIFAILQQGIGHGYKALYKIKD